MSSLSQFTGGTSSNAIIPDIPIAAGESITVGQTVAVNGLGEVITIDPITTTALANLGSDTPSTPTLEPYNGMKYAFVYTNQSTSTIYMGLFNLETNSVIGTAYSTTTDYASSMILVETIELADGKVVILLKGATLVTAYVFTAAGAYSSTFTVCTSTDYYNVETSKVINSKVSGTFFFITTNNTYYPVVIKCVVGTGASVAATSTRIGQYSHPVVCIGTTNLLLWYGTIDATTTTGWLVNGSTGVHVAYTSTYGYHASGCIGLWMYYDATNTCFQVLNGTSNSNYGAQAMAFKIVESTGTLTSSFTSSSSSYQGQSFTTLSASKKNVVILPTQYGIDLLSYAEGGGGVFTLKSVSAPFPQMSSYGVGKNPPIYSRYGTQYMSACLGWSQFDNNYSYGAFRIDETTLDPVGVTYTSTYTLATTKYAYTNSYLDSTVSTSKKIMVKRTRNGYILGKVTAVSGSFATVDVSKMDITSATNMIGYVHPSRVWVGSKVYHTGIIN